MIDSNTTCFHSFQDSIILGDDFVNEDGDNIVSKPLSPELQRVCLVGRQKMVDCFNEAFKWVDTLGDTPHLHHPRPVL